MDQNFNLIADFAGWPDYVVRQLQSAELISPNPQIQFFASPVKIRRYADALAMPWGDARFEVIMQIWGEAMMISKHKSSSEDALRGHRVYVTTWRRVIPCIFTLEDPDLRTLVELPWTADVDEADDAAESYNLDGVGISFRAGRYRLIPCTPLTLVIDRSPAVIEVHAPSTRG